MSFKQYCGDTIVKVSEGNDMVLKHFLIFWKNKKMLFYVICDGKKEEQRGLQKADLNQRTRVKS